MKPSVEIEQALAEIEGDGEREPFLVIGRLLDRLDQRIAALEKGQDDLGSLGVGA